MSQVDRNQLQEIQPFEPSKDQRISTSNQKSNQEQHQPTTTNTNTTNTNQQIEQNTNSKKRSSQQPQTNESQLPVTHIQQRQSSGSHQHQSSSHSTAETIVGVHFKVGKKIGEGSFGVLYEGVNMLTNQLVAVKFEPRKSDAPQLRDEFRTYKILRNVNGVPNVYYYGHEGLHNVLVIDLLGPSLEDLFDFCTRKFSIKTTCMVAKQMITRIQSVHEANLIYRDIKPDNFLIGRIPKDAQGRLLPIMENHSLENPHTASQVFVVDFGMAKQYRDPKTKQHIPYREKKSLSGTARYMSINTHMGREQSRRDDLESLGHVFVYFMKGSLPWQGLKAANNKQKYEKIGEKKHNTAVKDLCDGFPEEFATFLSYARGLKFEEEPDYDFLRKLFDKVLAKIGEKDDGIFDWMAIMDHLKREKLKKPEVERQSTRVVSGANGVKSSAQPASPLASNAPVNNTHAATAKSPLAHRTNTQTHVANTTQAQPQPKKKKKGFFARLFTCTSTEE